MKLPVTPLVLASFLALALSGCGPKDSSPAPAAAPAATPAAATPGTIDLTAGDNMKYSLPRIEVTPGLAIKLTFTNNGTQPKTVMAHNFVLLKKGTDVADFASSAVSAGKTNDYIPTDDMATQMIAHTKSLGPREHDTIEFTAPTEPGEYDFLCTFPGHYLIGMKGILVVK